MPDNPGPARCPRCGWPAWSAASGDGDGAGVERRSAHHTSAGRVRYARCVCGAWLVQLGERAVAAFGDGDI